MVYRHTSSQNSHTPKINKSKDNLKKESTQMNIQMKKNVAQVWKCLETAETSLSWYVFANWETLDSAFVCIDKSVKTLLHRHN